MRDLPLVVVLLAIVIFALSVFTDVMPPGVSRPARGVYNEGVQIVNSLARSVGVGAGSEYFMLLPR